MREALTPRSLRWLADSYEQAQSTRTANAEQIRAIVQGRDEVFDPLGEVVIPHEDEPEEEPFWIDHQTRKSYTADELLEAIGNGQTPGPVPILGRSFRRHLEEEEHLRPMMMSALRGHPTWPFLEEVPGMGPTLSCKILSRVDARKAPYPSSVWKYCGLALVPGERYKCEKCDLVRAWPAGYNVTGSHTKLGDTETKCSGDLIQIAGPEDGVKVAQPQPSSGDKASYDQYAKKVCWQIATSIIQQGARVDFSAYEEYYRRELNKAREQRPNWHKGRQEAKARRKMEKLFLSHLWEVWRAELGLPTPDPYVIEFEDGHRYVGPWEFLEDGLG